MAVRAGWCDEELRDDFPGIGVVALDCAVGNGAPERVARRMGVVSQRIDGRNAASMQLDAIPAAYRRLARQLGLDPDVDGTPLAALLRERIRWGRLPSVGVVRDACTCAMLETGVPVFALPLDEVTGDLGLTVAREGEVLPGHAGSPLGAGAVVISDLSRPLALAMLPPALEPAPRADVLLYALRAPGVADLELEEALWLAAGLLRGAADR
jgi:DNA/RNA-binding domain of Phe-tRNA-synthetase-like protein